MRTFQRIARLIRPAVAVPVMVVLALVGILVLALGCGGEDREPAATVSPTIRPRLRDVPVPAGFKFIANKSSDRMVDGLRFVEHMYGGDATVRSVSDWYRRGMPTLGWKLLEERFEKSRQRFFYEKGNENCYISVYDDWGTKIFIRIAPISARPAEPRPAPSP